MLVLPSRRVAAQTQPSFSRKNIISVFTLFLCGLLLANAAQLHSPVAHTLGNVVGESIMSRKALVWFRKGLRIHDNPSLLQAVKLNPESLCPVFVLDPRQLDPKGGRFATHRVRFLLESLADLDSSLRERGSRLLCISGEPGSVIPRVCEDWGITDVCYETDTGPYSLERDREVCKLLSDLSVDVHSFTSHTLYDMDSLMTHAGDKVPTSYKAFLALAVRAGPPSPPVDDPPTNFPGPCDAAVQSSVVTGVPDLAALGFENDDDTTIMKGGESEALKRVERVIKNEGWVAKFEKPKTDPTAERASTTMLSPYLTMGCLSARTFYEILRRIYAKYPCHAKPPVSLEGQLFWREFFYLNAYAVPNFGKMEGNPICRQIEWKTGAEAKELVRKWEFSQTGYPWIDAIMTQLRQEGWIHHLARHATACFLTRGDLWVHWTEGRDVFDRYLLDGDWSINNANWMWLSCSSYFYQYFRCYSPVAFPKKYDKSGNYVRRYLPVLKNLPDKYIYEPWTAPLSVQKSCGCVVGKDYPAPIVEHSIVVKENMNRMKAAYDAGKASAAKAPAVIASKKAKLR